MSDTTSTSASPRKDPAAPLRCVTCHEVLRADPSGWVCGCGSCLWSLEAVEALGGEILVETLVAAAKDDAPRGRRCPSCDVAFAVVFLPSAPLRGGRPEWDEQRVDVCVRCWLLWTDPGEMVNIGTEVDPTARPAREQTEYDTGPSLKEVLSTELHLSSGLKDVLATELHVPAGLKGVLSTELHLPSALKDALGTELHVPPAVKDVLGKELRIPRRRRGAATGEAAPATAESGAGDGSGTGA